MAPRYPKNRVAEVNAPANGANDLNRERRGHARHISRKASEANAATGSCRSMDGLCNLAGLRLDTFRPGDCRRDIAFRKQSLRRQDRGRLSGYHKRNPYVIAALDRGTFR